MTLISPLCPSQRLILGKIKEISVSYLNRSLHSKSSSFSSFRIPWQMNMRISSLDGLLTTTASWLSGKQTNKSQNEKKNIWNFFCVLSCVHVYLWSHKVVTMHCTGRIASFHLLNQLKNSFTIFENSILSLCVSNEYNTTVFFTFFFNSFLPSRSRSIECVVNIKIMNINRLGISIYIDAGWRYDTGFILSTLWYLLIHNILFWDW